MSGSSGTCGSGTRWCPRSTHCCTARRPRAAAATPGARRSWRARWRGTAGPRCPAGPGRAGLRASRRAARRCMDGGGRRGPRGCRTRGRGLAGVGRRVATLLLGALPRGGAPLRAQGHVGPGRAHAAAQRPDSAAAPAPPPRRSTQTHPHARQRVRYPPRVGRDLHGGSLRRTGRAQRRGARPAPRVRRQCSGAPPAAARTAGRPGPARWGRSGARRGEHAAPGLTPFHDARAGAQRVPMSKRQRSAVAKGV
jgi:hypothetical protein